MEVPAVVVAYDPQWPVVFELLRARADTALADVPHATEHVGSTAVPGLAAKPIIDMDVVVFRRGWCPARDRGAVGRRVAA